MLGHDGGQSKKYKNFQRSVRVKGRETRNATDSACNDDVLDPITRPVINVLHSFEIIILVGSKPEHFEIGFALGAWWRHLYVFLAVRVFLPTQQGRLLLQPALNTHSTG